MKYLEFRIGSKELAIDLCCDYIIEPTLINKIGPKTLNTRHSNLLDGLINYKNKMIEVFDIAPLYNQERLRKFDGLVFIENGNIYAIKFEGFHKFVHETNSEIIDIDKLIKNFES